MDSHCFTNINQAFQWMSLIASTSRTRTPSHQKLDRIVHILNLLDNPHLSYKSIHITGTKGKSSTAYACSYFLTKAHCNVGLFISPHIHSYNERISINHIPVNDETLLYALNIIYNITIQHKLSLTMFEILTASAALIFKQEQVEYAIFEVGIGGTHDTTNFLSPILCIITHIEKEHTNILGDSIEQITINKAGIIKQNVPVWIGHQGNPRALQILQDTAKEVNAPSYYLLDYIDIRISHTSKLDTRATIHVYNTNTHAHIFANWNNVQVKSPSIAPILLENQILADIAVQTILPSPLYIPTHKIYDEEIQLSCRAELLLSTHNNNRMALFLDGAHTPHSIDASLVCTSKISNMINLIVGFSSGKNITGIASVLQKYKSYINKIIVTKAGAFRYNDPHITFNILKESFSDVILIPDEIVAIETLYTFALSTNISSNMQPLSCVIGSFFLCSDCREWWINTTRNK